MTVQSLILVRFCGILVYPGSSSHDIKHCGLLTNHMSPIMLASLYKALQIRILIRVSEINYEE
jgi:hypothetical protein